MNSLQNWSKVELHLSNSTCIVLGIKRQNLDGKILTTDQAASTVFKIQAVITY